MRNSSLSRRERYTVAVLSCIAFALRIPLAFLPDQAIAGPDDTFYLFSIARNLANGHGFSVDGIHLTNGFQPLIVVVYAPIFWLCGSGMIDHADSWLAVRAIILFNGAITGLTVWGVAILIRSCERKKLRVFGVTAPMFGSLLWTFSISLFAHMSNNLETALYTLMLLVSLTDYARLLRGEASGLSVTLTQWIVLGILLGLTVLSRIDAAFLVAILVGIELWRRHILGGVLIGGTALVISAPWWINNLFYFGSLMPMSGQAENSWYVPFYYKLDSLVQTLDDISLVLFYTPHDLSLPIRILCGVAIVLLMYLVLRKTRVVSQLKQAIFLPAFLPLAFFSIVLVIYYTFFLSAPHFMLRYLQPLRMLWLLLVACAIPVVYDTYRRFSINRRRFTRAGIIIFLLFSLGFGIERYTHALRDRSPNGFYEMGEWAAQHPHEKIGMFQSGIASFIAPNVINLDGKVNFEALRAHQQGRFAEFLREEQFTYIADTKNLVEDLAGIARKGGLYFDSVSTIDGFQLMKRRDISPVPE